MVLRKHKKAKTNSENTLLKNPEYKVCHHDDDLKQMILLFQHLCSLPNILNVFSPT